MQKLFSQEYPAKARKVSASSCEVRWQKHKAAVEAHFVRTGSFPGQTKKDAEEYRLAKWVNAQKQSFKKGVLSQERAKLLLEISKDFFISQQEIDDEVWEENKAAVKAYFVQTGKMPNQHQKDRECVRLGTWINAQKHAFGKGVLGENRKKILLEISKDFFKTRKIANNEDWLKNKAAVKVHYDRTGRMPVRTSGDPEEAKLGRWVVTQKHAFVKGGLPQERIEMLHEISKDFLTRLYQQRQGEKYA